MKTVYLKLTNRCNLRCLHCYNSGRTEPDMNGDTLEKSVRYIENLAETENVLVVFHGGEPLVLDPDIYIDLTGRFERSGKINCSMTTNLVYELTEKHVRLFGMFEDIDGKSVSTSWDSGVRFRDGQEELWKKNVAALVGSGINVKPIVSVTKQLINEYADPVRLFDFFSNLGVRTMNFERITLNGRAVDNDVRPTNRETGRWLRDAYTASKNAGVKVVLFDILDQAMNHGNFIGCRGRRCVRDVVTINPDGTVSGCPNTADVVFGDVTGRSFEGAKACEIHKELFKTTECYACRWFRYCNGECYQLKSDETGCPGMREIFELNGL